MPDSIRIKEIHEALNAYKYALDDQGAPRVANLGYYIERIARVLLPSRQKNTYSVIWA
jgi:hypothetical protein